MNPHQTIQSLTLTLALPTVHLMQALDYFSIKIMERNNKNNNILGNLQTPQRGSY